METTLLDCKTYDQLTIVQLAVSGQDSLQYVSADSAIRNKSIEVKEVSQAGHVNSLLVANLSDHYVFMMDGDILAGAKQNRVINTSILLAPNSKTTIPVSCVEAGRWSHVSPSFAGTDYVAPASLRANKAQRVKESLKASGAFHSNQGEIWDGVTLFQMSAKVGSSTSNLSDVFDGKKSDFTKVANAFTCHPEANGFCFFLGSRLAGVDVFNRRDIYAEYFPKLLRGIALEVTAEAKRETAVGEAEARYRTSEFFDELDQLPVERYKGVALGDEHRFESQTLTGFSLWFGDHVVHLTALGKKTIPHPRRKPGDVIE